MYHRANAHLDSSWASSRPDYATAGPSSSSSHCRHNLATERRLIPDRFLEHNEDLGLLMPTGECVSSFLLSYSTTTQQRESSLASPLLLPTLPPVVQRIDMAGSPFSPFSPSNGPYGCYEENSFSQRRHLHPGQLLRAHSSGGGGSGGGGGDGSATAPADMTPGGGDSTDGDQPSEYTFRRRNAIVEGSDDAPKADDFPSSSPK
ncbi:hypothetical protein BGZ58_003112 [Dissophora ornata]|nr:hypothetical protein BGZ58_003112 [Dissophora ornata]